MQTKQDAPRKEASNSTPVHEDQQETASDLASSIKAQPDTVEEDVATTSDSRNVSTPKEATETKEDQPVTPLDIVLKITPPSDVHGEKHKHPHLVPSPYEHHFDTYSLVQDLARGDFTADQSVTIMKAVRLMLAVNLDIAKDG